MSTCVNVASQQLMKRPGPAGERKPLCLPGKNLLVRFFCFFDMTVTSFPVRCMRPRVEDESSESSFRVFHCDEFTSAAAK